MSSRDDSMTDERLDSLERWRTEFEAKFEAAFPHGDHVGHRAYHELMIEDLRDRRALIKAVKEKTIAGLVWATLFGIGLSCWHYAVDLIRKGN